MNSALQDTLAALVVVVDSLIDAHPDIPSLVEVGATLDAIFIEVLAALEQGVLPS